MDGVVITLIALCITLAALGTWYVAVEIYKLDHMPTRREVKREFYEADWNRIFEETELKKKGGKRK